MRTAMFLLIAILVVFHSWLLAVDFEPERHWTHSDPKVEREDPAYLRWKAAVTEYNRNQARYRELVSQGKGSSEEASLTGHIPAGYAFEPPPESVLCDAKGSPSVGANFKTYFLWPVLLGMLVAMCFKAKRPLLCLAAFAGLMAYIHAVCEQVGVIGFLVWLGGFLLLCAVLRFLKALFVG